MSLPPLETASIQTAHLRDEVPVTAQAAPLSNRSQAHRWLSVSKATSSWRTNASPLIMGALFLTILLPVGFLYLVQPRQPQLTPAQQQQMAMYLDENKQTQQLVANASADNSDRDNYVEATLTGSTAATNSEDEDKEAASVAAQLADSGKVKNKTYAYHLTLAQGFLRKAIDLSRDSQTAQTSQQQADIKKYLDQALASANQAIEADAREGSGFLVRARIYKTGAVLDPDLTELSDQDLQIARALGIDSNYLDQDDDIYDLLPTQQATELANAPIVADAEEGQDQTVSTSASANAESGTLQWTAGQETAQVEFPSLKAGQTIQVNPAAGQDAGGASFYIKSQKEAEGFTIATTQAPANDITVEWRVITPGE